jgi:hypothetical protein
MRRLRPGGGQAECVAQAGDVSGGGLEDGTDGTGSPIETSTLSASPKAVRLRARELAVKGPHRKGRPVLHEATLACWRRELFFRLAGPGAHDAGDCPTALRRAPSTSGASLVTAACEQAWWGRNTSSQSRVLQSLGWLHRSSCRATACSCTATARDAMIVGARVGCVDGLQGRATDCRAFRYVVGQRLWSRHSALRCCFPKLALALETSLLQVNGHTGRGRVAQRRSGPREPRGGPSHGFGDLQLTPHRDCALFSCQIVPGVTMATMLASKLVVVVLAVAAAVAPGWVLAPCSTCRSTYLH